MLFSGKFHFLKFSFVTSGTFSTEMDCTAVDAVYDRIKNSIRSTPMYQILRGNSKILESVVMPLQTFSECWLSIFKPIYLNCFT